MRKEESQAKGGVAGRLQAKRVEVLTVNKQPHLQSGVRAFFVPRCTPAALLATPTNWRPFLSSLHCGRVPVFWLQYCFSTLFPYSTPFLPCDVTLRPRLRLLHSAVTPSKNRTWSEQSAPLTGQLPSTPHPRGGCAPRRPLGRDLYSPPGPES